MALHAYRTYCLYVLASVKVGVHMLSPTTWPFGRAALPMYPEQGNSNNVQAFACKHAITYHIAGTVRHHVTWLEALADGMALACCSCLSTYVRNAPRKSAVT